MNALAPSRLRVSPYARRLARERAIPLDRLQGSGPGGRIVAADLRELPAPVAPAPVALARIPAAFAARVDLGLARQLVTQAAAAGLALTIEDIALRAAGWALAGLDLPEAPDNNRDLTLEDGPRQILVRADGRLAVSAQRRALQDAQAEGRDDSAAPAILSVQFLASARVSPVLMPLLDWRAMRLRLGVTAESEGLSALLCADTGQIPDTVAIAFLDAFAEAMEQPLGLLA